MIKKLKAKNDFVFQRIFGRQENKDILISLLNAILTTDDDKKITDIEILNNTKLEKDLLTDKEGILDVRAKTAEGAQINIEVQLINQYNMEKRTLFYWSKMFTEQLNPGEDFKELKKTITINILDFNYINIEKHHTIFHLREDQEKEYILTDALEIHFIELPKFRKIKPDINKSLDRWLLFLDNTTEEVLEMIKEQDPAIQKADKLLEYLSSNEEMIRLYELREKAIHDEITRMNGAREEGRKEGKLEDAKEMLKEGISIERIAKITKLPVEEIKKLLN